MFKHLVGLGILFCFGSTLAVPASASEECISGNISAQVENTGPYAGLYKYTIDVTWSSEKGLSHVTLDLGLGQCRELACASTWIFPNPAGTGSGGESGDLQIKRSEGGDDDDEGDENEDCTFIFSGEFNCKGDPSIGFTDPVLTWDVIDGGPCEAGKAGSATLCFYTDVPPSNGLSPTAINKNGRNVCSGSLTGVVPVICPVSTEPTAWSRIKVIFGTD